MRHLLITSVLLILLILLSALVSELIVLHSSAAIPSDPGRFIADSSSFHCEPFVPDCSESDVLSGSKAAWGEVSGFGKELPVGFDREGYSMQGAASAVEWYGGYVYLAAASVLQVYHVPPGATPELIHEIELRDWVREMEIAGDTLFMAARGSNRMSWLDHGW
jgi:hypothetical protein